MVHPECGDAAAAAVHVCVRAYVYQEIQNPDLWNITLFPLEIIQIVIYLEPQTVMACGRWRLATHSQQIVGGFLGGSDTKPSETAGHITLTVSVDRHRLSGVCWQHHMVGGILRADGRFWCKQVAMRVMRRQIWLSGFTLFCHSFFSFHSVYSCLCMFLTLFWSPAHSTPFFLSLLRTLPVLSAVQFISFSLQYMCFCLRLCVRSHPGDCHIYSDVASHSLPLPPCLYLSLSACMVARQLSGKLSFPGKQLWMTRNSVEGEDNGANVPSPCPPFWGHKWSPVPPIILHPLLHPSPSPIKLMSLERGHSFARRPL